MSVQSEFARLGALIRQLQGALGGCKVAAGVVTSAGAISSAGTDNWTVVRNSLGNYTVTFTTAFAAVPAVTVTAVGPAGTAANYVIETTPVAGSVVVVIKNVGVAFIDAPFSFHAIGK